MIIGRVRVRHRGAGTGCCCGRLTGTRMPNEQGVDGPALPYLTVSPVGRATSHQLSTASHLPQQKVLDGREHMSVRQRPKKEGRQMRGHLINHFAWFCSVCPGRLALVVAQRCICSA